MTALDILLALFILVITGASLSFKYVTGWKYRRQLKEFTPLAQKAGWLIEETEREGSAIKIVGKTPSGLGWEMVLSGRDRQGKQTSYWNCRDIGFVEGAIVIGEVPQDVEITDSEEEMTREETRAEFVWRKAEMRFGDVPEEVMPFQVGSLRFQEHFVVLATGEKENGELLMNTEVEEQLLQWLRTGKESRAPLILFTEKGLFIGTEWLKHFEEIESIVKLGSTMAEKVAPPDFA